MPLLNNASLSSSSSSLDESNHIAAQASLLPDVKYQFDAAEPASPIVPSAERTGIQLDAGGNVLSIRGSQSQDLASHGFGALSLVSYGGPNNAPFSRGRANL